MANSFTAEEKRIMIAMATKGHTRREIADKLRPGMKSAHQTIGKIIRQLQADPVIVYEDDPEPSDVVPPSSPVTVTSTAKRELPMSLKDSLSAKEFIAMMEDDQREILIATYEELRGEADENSLTRAENEMLLRAAFAHTQYLRANKYRSLCEKYLMMELDGKLDEKNAKDKSKIKMAGRADSYKKESEQYHKEYCELIDNLKLTRKQRLDKIKDTRNTFLSLQQELAVAERKESVVEEIMRINMATKEEFHRMAKGEKGPDGRVHRWLVGAFDEV